MPDFPRQHSQAALTTRKPRADRNDADIRTDAADRNKIFTKGANDAANIALKWKASVDKIQGDTALYNMKIGMLEINSGVATSTNITDESRWQKKVQDLRKNVIQGMDPEAIKAISPELNYLAEVGRIGITAEYQKKTIIHGQAVKQGEIMLEVNNPTPNSAANIESLINQGIQEGLWDEVQGAKKKQQFTDQMKENMFIRDTNTNLKQARENLQNNTYGFTIEDKDKAWNVYEQESKLIRDQNEVSFIDQIRNMDKTGISRKQMIEQIEESRKNEMIDATFATSKIKDLETVTIPKTDSLEANTEYAKLIDMKTKVMASEDSWMGMGRAAFEDRVNYRAAVFNAHRKGYITTAEMNKIFLNSTTDASLISTSSKRFTNAMKEMFAFADGNITERERSDAKHDMSQSVINKVIAGATPEDAFNEAQAEYIQSKYPDANAVDLLYGAKKHNKPVWMVYKLQRKR